ncbi:MAG TPA: SRPBCC family protein [Burkholderiaceae bacterium]|nr:SRPBCC family protein [Burkholderiaceae bacterium]
MADYRLITHWHIEAPLHDVYNTIFHSLEWPSWWRGVIQVQECTSGREDGIGSVRRYIWKSRLPYRLSFDARTTRIESMAVLEAAVTGDLEGIGRWLFSQSGAITTVRYEWQVRTTRSWMNLLAPLARFIFRNNHDALMQRGAEGLARQLNARLVAVSHTDLPPEPASCMQYADH